MTPNDLELWMHNYIARIVGQGSLTDLNGLTMQVKQSFSEDHVRTGRTSFEPPPSRYADDTA